MGSENHPKVSVLMSVYKEPFDWIEEAIGSILNQTFKDFEFIIINDNPEDLGLRKFLDEQNSKDTRIRLVTNETNIGLTKSLNEGLKLCNGEYIARMDADDICASDRFVEQVKVLDRFPQIGIVGSWIKMVGTKRGKVKLPTENEDIKAFQIFSSPFDHPATIMRKSTLDKNGLQYNETLKHAQDQQLWYELSKICEFANVPKFLFNHRYNDQQISKLHLESQRTTTRMVRSNMVKDVLSKFSFSNINFEELTFNDLSKLNMKFKNNQHANCDFKIWGSTLKVLSLTLHNYNWSSLLQFLKSGIYLQAGWTIKDFIRVIYKHINNNYYDAVPMS